MRQFRGAVSGGRSGLALRPVDPHRRPETHDALARQHRGYRPDLPGSGYDVVDGRSFGIAVHDAPVRRVGARTERGGALAEAGRL